MTTPIRFFTIVLNGMPFLKYHLPMLQKLNVPWEWHIAEGLAELRHDTAWSVRKRWSWRKPFRLQTTGFIPHHLHDGGRSIDGTSEYLDAIASLDSRVKIFRTPRGKFWDGKREMVRAACAGLNAETLLWQVDSDELWTVDQIHTVHEMFAQSPDKMAARYWCHYYVGPELEITDRNCYGNGRDGWIRTWRARPGDAWEKHEPPLLTRDGVPLCSLSFLQDETEAKGLVFEHYAYVTEAQAAFKEAYYGYTGALRYWRKLQQATPPLELGRYLPWVHHAARVERRPPGGLASYDPKSDRWSFPSPSVGVRALRQVA
ncbi:MAG TPA: hypothetical protein VHY91_24395 [Pirellulales bacterium]|jgi:hypothetical protein|nr:hypothetical protein [Pirellulales bacterium]